jgi:UDP-4-amino-4,6-dideoxy-N-acetyl-beta-L-altrosamine transaminase
MTYLPYGRQEISQADIDQVATVLNSDYLTQGPAGPRFEADLATYTGAKYVRVTNSATSALHLACLALGLGSGDLLWTTAITFVASANCALYCGARVGFVDIDPTTNNLSIEDLDSRLRAAKRAGDLLPKILVVVHFAGRPVDMSEIRKLSSEFGFKVIEDASHAIGATYHQSKIGACEFSDVTVFSFHPVKIITTGEGGALATNSKTVAREIELMRSHGITRDADEMTKSPDGPWYYEQLKLGYNYRMTDIQAALGTSQLKRIDEFVESRSSIAQRYDHLLAGLELEIPGAIDTDIMNSAWHLYVIRIPADSILGTRNQVFERLRANGIGVNLHYIPVYRQPYYAEYGYNNQDYPQSEKYYSEAISLPIFPSLREDEQARVVDLLATQTGHQTIF